MSGSHSHRHVIDPASGAGRWQPDTGEPAGPVTVRRGVEIGLAVAVVVLAVATAVGLGLLWQHGPAPKAPLAATMYADGTIQQASVISARAFTCPGLPDDRLPDGSIPSAVTCGAVQARLVSGARSGETISVQVAPQIFRSGINPGDRIDVVRTPPAAGAGLAYAWVDFHRELPLGVLAVVFVLLVVAVARLRGIAAIIGLGLTLLTVLKFMLPALRAGEDGLAVAVVGSAAILIVILYLAHGVSTKTTTALLGTLAGLGVTAGLAAWAGAAAHLNGLTSQDNDTLSLLTDNGNLAGLVLCGIILAGLGVLNDVTVTQASAVWELHEQAPHLPAARLFASGMRIGRDHLASTVYTIVFAYAGAALPTLLLIDIYRQPLGQVLSSGQIAEEVVRTLVGVIGLILAIPLTTALAAAVVTAGRRDGHPL